MSVEFEVGPVPVRLPITEDVVRRLVIEQFPQWADLEISRVALEGWDNRTFHLGDEMLVRLPSAEAYASAVEKEHRWLPVLAPQLPLAIPIPLAKNAPNEHYPLPWSVYRWLDGEPASVDGISDLNTFAVTLAAFLGSLQKIDPAGGPEPGQHNWFRGGPVRTYGAEVARALEELDGHLDIPLATEIWECALTSAWDRRPVWFHGDMAAGNLLVRDGALSAVIDFGTCGVGDSACDLVIAWNLLSGESLGAFRDRLAVDPGTWARGRGWALWKALVTYSAARDTDKTKARTAKEVLDRIFAEYAQAS